MNIDHFSLKLKNFEYFNIGKFIIELYMKVIKCFYHLYQFCRDRVLLKVKFKGQGQRSRKIYPREY